MPVPVPAPIAPSLVAPQHEDLSSNGDDDGDDDLTLNQLASAEMEVDEKLNDYEHQRRRKRFPVRRKYLALLQERQRNAQGLVACKICGATSFNSLVFVDNDWDCDHIDELADDGEDDNSDNLQLIDPICHRRKTRECELNRLKRRRA